jgi:hypothetical protein
MNPEIPNSLKTQVSDEEVVKHGNAKWSELSEETQSELIKRFGQPVVMKGNTVIEELIRRVGNCPDNENRIMLMFQGMYGKKKEQDDRSGYKMSKANEDRALEHEDPDEVTKLKYGGLYPILLNNQMLVFSVDYFYNRLVTDKLIVFEDGGIIFPYYIYSVNDESCPKGKDTEKR